MVVSAMLYSGNIAGNNNNTNNSKKSNNTSNNNNGYGLGIPKSPSFHSGLDLLADDDHYANDDDHHLDLLNQFQLDKQIEQRDGQNLEHFNFDKDYNDHEDENDDGADTDTEKHYEENKSKDRRHFNFPKVLTSSRLTGSFSNMPSLQQDQITSSSSSSLPSSKASTANNSNSKSNVTKSNQHVNLNSKNIGNNCENGNSTTSFGLTAAPTILNSSSKSVSPNGGGGNSCVGGVLVGSGGNFPNVNDSVLSPQTLQQITGSPGRARDRNLFHSPSAAAAVSLALLRGFI